MRRNWHRHLASGRTLCSIHIKHLSVADTLTHCNCSSVCNLGYIRAGLFDYARRWILKLTLDGAGSRMAWRIVLKVLLDGLL